MRRRKLAKDADLSEIFYPGDKVRLEFLPADKYRFKSGASFPKAGLNTAPLMGRAVDGTIRGVGGSMFDFSMAGCDSVLVSRGQITHYRILEVAPRPRVLDLSAYLRLRFECGGLAVNGTWVSKSEIAKIADAAGWTYHGGDAAEYFEDLSGEPIFASDHLVRLGESARRDGCYTIPGIELRAGCARATREELDTALDWCAECFGWL